MMMVPIEPAARDFAIECFLEDWDQGRATAIDGESIRAQLRHLGDVARLEAVARRIAGHR
jgi:hypothetical protein